MKQCVDTERQLILKQLVDDTSCLQALKQRIDDKNCPPDLSTNDCIQPLNKQQCAVQDFVTTQSCYVLLDHVDLYQLQSNEDKCELKPESSQIKSSDISVFKKSVPVTQCCHVQLERIDATTVQLPSTTTFNTDSSKEAQLITYANNLLKTSQCCYVQLERFDENHCRQLVDDTNCQLVDDTNCQLVDDTNCRLSPIDLDEFTLRAMDSDSKI